MRPTTLFRLLATMLALALGAPAAAEDGYDLWLRYRPVADAPALHARAGTIVAPGRSATVRAAVAELARGLSGMSGQPVVEAGAPGAGAILIATPAQSPEVAKLRLPLARLGREGFLLRATRIAGAPVTVIAANSDIGLLYGAFRLLRLAQVGGWDDRLDVADAPKLQLRLLNHWDNPDRTVERGYAGQSIWDWWKLPDRKDPRYTDYARANASIGINGTVLNNVNAKAVILTPAWIAKAAALADVFRPYGIKVYLSVRWTAPMELGGLKDADPLDPMVAAWWKAKADEIYRVIPDFGGFLVKANSEGEPGPGDYKRSHADGANMLAAALKPHGGAVIWRAFVYSEVDPEDRAKQAYAEFKPLDGRFADNVLVQVKNGAIDFQPREPFHPLFGAMPKTPLMMEFQITKEYLGFATHLVYLGPLFAETLASETGRGGTVAEILEKPVRPGALTGMAGVANIGVDRNWSGSVFNQANWYAYGRVAWDPQASPQAIAREWAALTFAPDERVVAPVTAMMMRSREAAVDYMTPLGLAHLMATGHHYGPAPWVADLKRPEWNPAYYHRADKGGIGFDRTRAGTNAVDQYAPSVARIYADPRRTPERDLLWFHHLPWSWRLRSGETLWDGLVHRYDHGVVEVAAMRGQWDALRPLVDPERFGETETFLAIQEREARWWRDASIAYWQSLNGLPLPADAPPPAESLDHYKAIVFPYAPGH